MATWIELSISAIDAAKALLSEDQLHPRSSISRSYYSAYSAIAGKLSDRDVTFAEGRDNPLHSKLPGSVNLIRGITEVERQSIRRAVRRLWSARVDADYVPVANIDETVALGAFRDASSILRTLGLKK